MSQRTCVVVVLTAVLLVLALPAAAAIQYDFFQKTSSDGPNPPAGELSARAVVDGARSRVDFIGGTMYPPGTYMISNDGARTMRFVDPLHKSYTEVNVSAVASAIGAANIKIDNLKSAVTKLDDRPIIAGLPSEHYRLVITYDITLTRGLVLTQSVRTVIDRWTTGAFGNVSSAAVSGGPTHTGNPEADELIGLETTKIPGFTLKELVTITSSNPRHKQIPGSKLNLPATRTRTRETQVTSVRELNPDPRHFDVPATYRKSEVDDSLKTQVHTLTFEPSTK